jgi:hypothetical protein
MRIYKYYSFNESDFDNDKKIESFKENYLWFSKPTFFNDPFDCNMEIIMHYNNFLNSVNSISDKAEDLIISATKDFGICCFSETNDNIHMWSHYAQSHKGICVEYDFSDDEDYFSNLLQCNCSILDVDYRDKLIDLNGDIELKRNPKEVKTISEIIKNPKSLDILFEKLLLQKNKTIWSNEKEKRIIIGGQGRENNKDKEVQNGYKIPIERKFIKSVIFGVNASKNLRSEMMNIFKDQINYKNAELDFEKWSLKIN